MKQQKRRRPQGTGNLTYLASTDRWQARIYQGPKRRHFYGKTRQEAEDKMLAFMSEYQRNTWLQAERLMFRRLREGLWSALQWRIVELEDEQHSRTSD
jgi:hypothetical protein